MILPSLPKKRILIFSRAFWKQSLNLDCRKKMALLVATLVIRAHITSQNVGICHLGQCAEPSPGKRGRPRIGDFTFTVSPKPVLTFSLPGETLPLVLALFAFVGFTLMLVVVSLSIWKMGRLLRYSCCPAVGLPDTLVRASFLAYSGTLIRYSLGFSWV